MIHSLLKMEPVVDALLVKDRQAGDNDLSLTCVVNVPEEISRHSYV